jgi:hypothetical protein
MRGFITGSLALVVLYVFLQPGSTNKLVTGNNALMTMFRRALSGDVAAIPNKHDKAVPKKSGLTTTDQQNLYTV